MKETEIAKQVCDWLISQDWDVYQEIQCRCGIIDIVAINEPISWAIEVKTSLSLQLLNQIIKRRQIANFISIAVPNKCEKTIQKNHDLMSLMQRQYGLGVITVGSLVYEHTPAQLCRVNTILNIRNDLKPQHKYWCEAGTNQGGYFTEFALTKQRLIRYVTNNEGCTLKEAIEQIDTHYSSKTTAKSCISKYIRSGVIKEINAYGKPLKLYLSG